MKKTLLALALALSASSAQAVLMTDLLNGGSITAGDKLFDSWEVFFTDSSDPNRTVDTDNIDVVALNDGGLDPGPGLQFNILNNEFDVTGDGIYAYLDFTFGFRASVLAPNLLIKDNSLIISDATLQSNPDLADLGVAIVEDIFDANNNPLGDKYVEFSVLDGNLTANTSDSAAFAPQDEIWVTKNILIWASTPDDTAQLSGFTQRFSQTTVPEPATLALLGLGFAGLAAARRRKSA